MAAASSNVSSSGSEATVASSTRLVFLGTGASGGTPGVGRSRRTESSLLVEGETSLLVDATRDLRDQMRTVRRIDAILLTHAHRDASGGIPALRSWWQEQHRAPLPLSAHAETLAALEHRYARLDHCVPAFVVPGRPFRFAEWKLEAIEVPHTHDPDVPTLAWRISRGGQALVYASDVSNPERRLARFARGANLLVIDGATYGRRIFTHLRIDDDLPSICEWEVDRIFLTQIGRSAPPHEQLRRTVAHFCRRARPAYDGLTVRL